MLFPKRSLNFRKPEVLLVRKNTLDLALRVSRPNGKTECHKQVIGSCIAVHLST